MGTLVDQATQIILGSTAAQAFLGPRLGWKAALVGGAAGIVPDLDMLLRPLADPLFPMEIHRTFSHSLVAIPVGAAVVGSLFMLFPAFRRRGPWIYLAALIGWATHGPLDACTSYGTMLFWPFDATWISWDLVAIVDPIFSLTLLVGLVLALKRGRSRPALIAFLLALAYLGVGVLQRDRAQSVQTELAAARGDTLRHARVIPVLGGLVFWRSLYVDASGQIHADHFRLVPGLAPAVLEAGAVPAATMADLPEDVPDRADVEAVFRRYLTFADGLAARIPGDEEVVGDMRYSITPGFYPAWGVRTVPGERPLWIDRVRVCGPDLERLFGTMLGTTGTYVPLAEVVASGK